MLALWTGPCHVRQGGPPRPSVHSDVPAWLSHLCQLPSHLPFSWEGRHELIGKDMHASLHVCTYGDTRLQTHTCVRLSLSGSLLFPSRSCPVASGSLSEAGALSGSPGRDLEEGEAGSGPPWKVSLGARHPGLYQAAPPRPCQENPFPGNHLQGVTETWPGGKAGVGAHKAFSAPALALVGK